GFAIVLLWNSSRRNDCTLRKRTPLQEQKLNLQDCAVAGLFLIVALYLADAETLSRGFVLLFVVLVACGLGLRRLIYRALPREQTGPSNVLIIGLDPTAVAIREQLRDDSKLGYSFRGFVKLSELEPDSAADPNEVVGTIDKLAEHIRKYSVTEVFLTS